MSQILYNSAFTAVSFFLPIVVLFRAFYYLATDEKANWLLVVTSGLLTGIAVCGMHYVGQLGIFNYHCEYKVGSVVGSAIVAIAASAIALGVFFRLQET